MEGQGCVYKRQTEQRQRRRERNLPTNVNFPPVMSKMIKMTDILLLINLRRADGGRGTKGKRRKTKVNRPHVFIVSHCSGTKENIQ